MACKSLIRKKVQVISLLVLFLNINVFKVFALTTQNLYFYKDVMENNISSYTGKVPNFVISSTSGISSISFDILDKNNNVVKSGFYQGELPSDDSIYPLKVVAKPVVTNSNWNIRVSVTYEDSTDLSGIEGLLKSMGNLLDSIKNKLNDILNSLKQIDDYLSNPARLDHGLNDLKNSVDNLSKNPVSDVASTQNTLSSIGVGSSSGGGGTFNIPVTIGGQTFNALDFSALNGHLKTIRALMSAILWIEFSVFCIKIVVPKFKV